MLRGALVLVVIVHLLPALGLLGPQMIERGYGVDVDSPDLAVLLIHRAALFALLAMVGLSGAIVADWRRPATAVLLASMFAYLLVTVACAWLIGPPGAPIWRVFWIDLVAGLVLAGAAIVDARSQRQR
jgi:hypothetical protein